ncbi:MAG TPA: SDR family oxidoreductase [Blastocatellia bacterium]|nr:SDR family oxidoreductase [Blastocatellia bacterium]
MRLEGKVSIVTGGGRGIGLAIAQRFAAEGSAVVVSGTSKDALEKAAAEINNHAGRALSRIADVADEDQVVALVEATMNEFGRIDVLVNNAGIAGPTALVTEVKLEDWERTLAVNLTGAFLCAKHALPHMIQRRGGSIINITSVAGLNGYAWRSPYCASKWGMIGLTRTLAEEAGRYDITCNAIAPGPIRGPRIEQVIRSRAEQMNRSYAEVELDYVGPTALKRMAEESDIAAMTLYLASEEGRNITGETLNISAGYKLS